MYKRHHLILPLLLTACSSAAKEPTQASIPPTPGEIVGAAIDAGQVDRAYGLVRDLYYGELLTLAREGLAEGRLADAWHAVGVAGMVGEVAAPECVALKEEIGERLLLDRLWQGQRLLTEGNPRDAMLRLDEALEYAPEDPRTSFLRGVALARIGTEDQDPFFFADALKSYLVAARGGGWREAWFGAADSAFLMYFDGQDPKHLQEAWEYIGRGRGEAVDTEREALLREEPERTWARVSSWCLALARQGELPQAARDEFLQQRRAALEALLGRAGDDEWAWREIARSYSELEAGKQEAYDILMRALQLLPLADGLHADLAAVARELGGTEMLVGTYRAFVAAHPDSAAARWQLGLGVFEEALGALAEEAPDTLESFAAAEAEFAVCRSLDAERESACYGYEVICRNGAGRAAYLADDYAEAQRLYLSMEELFPGGLEWKLEGRLNSGFASLNGIIKRYFDTSVDPESTPEQREEVLVQAAELSVFLHEYKPESADLANDAGFFNRDAGVALEERAAALVASLEGADAPTGAARVKVLAEARELVARATSLMERSYLAYKEAATLAPEDARIVNDTGLIMAYYLRTDADEAERYLMNAYELGNRQLADGIEDEQERFDLVQAVGDAYENLGYLELTLRKQPIHANAWFEKSLDMAGVPRPNIPGKLLPECEALLSGELTDAAIDAEYAWPVRIPD